MYLPPIALMIISYPSKLSGDNHLLELASASQAGYLITGNSKDFENGNLLFPDIAIVTPKEFMEQWSN